MEKAANEDANERQQHQLGPAELDQVQDYLRLHRAALRFEPGLVQEPGQLLALLDISPPAVRGLLVNALRCAGRLDLANRYDIERRIDASLSTSAASASFATPTGRRRGQFALTVEVSAIQVCPADFGLLTAAAAAAAVPATPSASTPAAAADRPVCWISVEALNQSVDDLVSLAVGEDSRLCSTPATAGPAPDDPDDVSSGCCGRLFRFSLRRRGKRPARSGRQRPFPTPQSAATSKNPVLTRSNRKYLADQQQQQQQFDAGDSMVAADGAGSDGLLVRKARLLAEKSAELYQAVLADSEQRLVRYLEQDCGLLCLEAGSDPYCGLQLQLAATTADCLRRFLASLSNGTVARRLEQLLLSDRLLASLRLRRCKLRCCAQQCDLALADLTG